MVLPTLAHLGLYRGAQRLHALAVHRSGLRCQARDRR